MYIYICIHIHTVTFKRSQLRICTLVHTVTFNIVQIQNLRGEPEGDHRFGGEMGQDYWSSSAAY